MECRLRQAPLAKPKRVLAREQAVADTISQAIVERTLVIVAGVVLKDMFDVRGIRQEEPVIRASLQVNDIAIPIRGVEKRADRIGAQVRKYAKKRIPTGSGRKA
jgi:hypothetical protein